MPWQSGHISSLAWSTRFSRPSHPLTNAPSEQLFRPVLPCSFNEIEGDFDALISEVAADQRIDPVCSTSKWILPAAAAFAASAEPRVFAGNAGYLALLEHDAPNGPVLTGFDSIWGFATPLIGRDPALAVQAFGEIMASLDFYAVSLSGIDATGPLFAPLQALGPVGFNETADRMVADLSGGFDDWLDRRSPRFRRSLRAAAHRASREGLQIETVAPSDSALALQRVLAIEAQSWKAEAGSGLIGTDLGWFTQTMSRRFAASERLHTHIAVLHGRDVGYVIGGSVGTRYRGFQQSFVNDLRHLSIGKVLQMHNIEACAAAGIETYDMGMRMAYKESYSDRAESTISLIYAGKR